MIKKKGIRHKMICVGDAMNNINPSCMDIPHVVWGSWGLKTYDEIYVEDGTWCPCKELIDRLKEFLNTNKENLYDLVVVKTDSNKWTLRLEYPSNLSAGWNNSSNFMSELMDAYAPFVEMWLDGKSNHTT